MFNYISFYIAANTVKNIEAHAKHGDRTKKLMDSSLICEQKQLVSLRLSVYQMTPRVNILHFSFYYQKGFMPGVTVQKKSKGKDSEDEMQ